MNLSLRIKYKHGTDIIAENSKTNESHKFVLNLKTTLNKVVNKAGEYLEGKIAGTVTKSNDDKIGKPIDYD